MKPVALLTPTYGRDLELCTLLCESVDRHVTSFSKHYLLVPDCDSAAVRSFRERTPESYFPHPNSCPNGCGRCRASSSASGVNIGGRFEPSRSAAGTCSSILKIAATMSLPHQRYCILDSDVVFFRDFDLARFEYPNSNPLLNMPDEVTADQIRHSRWVDTNHQLLGLPVPPLPASDFIGHIIFWDQQTMRAMTRKIEAVTNATGSRRFAGFAAFRNTCCTAISFATTEDLPAGTRSARARHASATGIRQNSAEHELNRLLRAANEQDVAFSVASFSGTPVQSIRAAIDEVRASVTRIAAKEPEALDALC